MFSISLWPKAKTIITEFCLANWFKHLFNTLLYYAVPYTWYSKRIGLCWVAYFRNIDYTYRFWGIPIFLTGNNILDFFNHFFRCNTPDILNRKSICTSSFAAYIGFDISICQ